MKLVDFDQLMMPRTRKLYKFSFLDKGDKNLNLTLNSDKVPTNLYNIIMMLLMYDF